MEAAQRNRDSYNKTTQKALSAVHKQGFPPLTSSAALKISAWGWENCLPVWNPGTSCGWQFHLCPTPTASWQDRVSSLCSKDARTILPYLPAISIISNMTTVLLLCVSIPASSHPNPCSTSSWATGWVPWPSQCLSACNSYHSTASTSAMTRKSEEQPSRRALGWGLAGKTAGYTS